MSRIGMDLCVLLLVILGYNFIWEWANGNEELDSLAGTVAIVDTVVLTIYLGAVIVPHYASRIHDVDVGILLKRLGFYIPIVILILMLSIRGDLMEDSEQTKMMIAFYIVVFLAVMSILRFLYVHYYLKNKEKKDKTEEIE